jgi:hypothetical protein
MKNKFARLIEVLFVLAALALSTAPAASADILPNDPDFGFKHDIKQFPTGSKVALIFQGDTMMGKTRFGVSTDNVDTNIEMLTKYMKWAELAQQRGDDLNKEIGVVRGFDYGLFDYWNRYEFQTNKTLAGNSYVICIQPGKKLFGMFRPGSVDDNTQAAGPLDFRTCFNKTAVQQIIQRMQDFKEGKMKSNADAASDYK